MADSAMLKEMFPEWEEGALASILEARGGDVGAAAEHVMGYESYAAFSSEITDFKTEIAEDRALPNYSEVRIPTSPPPPPGTRRVTLPPDFLRLPGHVNNNASSNNARDTDLEMAMRLQEDEFGDSEQPRRPRQQQQRPPPPPPRGTSSTEDGKFEDMFKKAGDSMYKGMRDASTKFSAAAQQAKERLVAATKSKDKDNNNSAQPSRYGRLQLDDELGDPLVSDASTANPLDRDWTASEQPTPPPSDASRKPPPSYDDYGGTEL